MFDIVFEFVFNIDIMGSGPEKHRCLSSTFHFPHICRGWVRGKNPGNMKIPCIDSFAYAQKEGIVEQGFQKNCYLSVSGTLKFKVLNHVEYDGNSRI